MYISLTLGLLNLLNKFHLYLIFFQYFNFQEQERLTREIAESVVAIANPVQVTVSIEAVHTCMIVRGVQQPNSKTVTRYLALILSYNGRSCLHLIILENSKMETLKLFFFLRLK